MAKVFRLLCRMRIVKPFKVVLMDGGICSQILQYYQGIVVAPSFQPKFDMTFWEKGGRDCLGNYNRPFELESIFPNILIEKCGKRKAAFYRRYLQSSSLETSIPPVYINNYKFGCSLTCLHEVFNLRMSYLDENKRNKSNELIKSHSCGIHIRRGDLANNDNPYYGFFSEDYLLKAMKYVMGRDRNVSFYVFSDDMDYVKSSFINKCSWPVSLMEGNTGGEDLILLSSCRYIIASQGTAGRLAALINGSSLLIMKEGDPHNRRYLEAYNNCVVL